MNTTSEKSFINAYNPPQEAPLPAYAEFDSAPQLVGHPALAAPGKPVLFPQQCVFKYRMSHSHSYLGVTKDEPMHLVRTPRFTMGSGDIVLLSGTDKLDTPIASIGALNLKRGTGAAAEIRFKPRPGSSISQPMDISMTNGLKNKYQFTVPVGPAGRQATFEWRQSTGELVQNLAGGFQYGMKLVHLDGAVGSSSLDLEKDSQATVVASDGKPIVAIFAAVRPQANHAKFHFMNEGATGELGEVFEIVAMMSFMRLYELQLSQGGVAIGPCLGSLVK